MNMMGIFCTMTRLYPPSLVLRLHTSVNKKVIMYLANPWLSTSTGLYLVLFQQQPVLSLSTIQELIGEFTLETLSSTLRCNFLMTQVKSLIGLKGGVPRKTRSEAMTGLIQNSLLFSYVTPKWWLSYEASR